MCYGILAHAHQRARHWVPECQTRIHIIIHIRAIESASTPTSSSPALPKAPNWAPPPPVQHGRIVSNNFESGIVVLVAHWGLVHSVVWQQKKRTGSSIYSMWPPTWATIEVEGLIDPARRHARTCSPLQKQGHAKDIRLCTHRDILHSHMISPVFDSVDGGLVPWWDMHKMPLPSSGSACNGVIFWRYNKMATLRSCSDFCVKLPVNLQQH